MENRLISAALILLTACGSDLSALNANKQKPDVSADDGSSNRPSLRNDDPDAGDAPSVEDSSVALPDASEPGEDSSVAASDAGEPIVEEDAGDAPSNDDAGTTVVEHDAGSSNPECSGVAKQCSGSKPQTCVSGKWVSSKACAHGCSDGACKLGCNPNDKQCSGLDSQVCSAQGEWETVETCAFLCGGAGVCSGECSPLTSQCAGSDHPGTIVACQADGFWTGFECDAGNACITDGGYPHCGQHCKPGAAQCSTEGNAETCNKYGLWAPSESCDFACVSGSCTGVCKPGTTDCSGAKLTTCDKTGQWVASTCPAVLNAVNACAAGACVPTCKTNFGDCDGKLGCEVHTDTDSDNCGACGHSCCGGGECSAGTCQAAEVLVTKPSSWFDVDDSNIYWSTLEYLTSYTVPSFGDLNKAPLANLFPTETLVASQQSGFSVVVHEVTVFVTTMIAHIEFPYTGGVFSVTSDGTKTAYTTEGVAASLLRFDDNNIVWKQVTSGSSYNVICSRELSRATGVVCYQPSASWQSPETLDMASDGTYIYATVAVNGGQIWRIKIQKGWPGTDSTMTSGNQWQLFEDASTGDTNRYYSNLTTDGANVYAAFYGGTSKALSGVWKLPTDGSPKTQLSSEYAGQVTTDGEYVFYYSGSGGGNSSSALLRRVSVNGGTVITLSSKGAFGDTPRFNSECVFTSSETSTVNAETGAGTLSATISTINKEP